MRSSDTNRRLMDRHLTMNYPESLPLSRPLSCVRRPPSLVLNEKWSWVLEHLPHYIFYKLAKTIDGITNEQQLPPTHSHTLLSIGDLYLHRGYDNMLQWILSITYTRQAAFCKSLWKRPRCGLDVSAPRLHPAWISTCHLNILEGRPANPATVHIVPRWKNKINRVTYSLEDCRRKIVSNERPTKRCACQRKKRQASVRRSSEFRPKWEWSRALSWALTHTPLQLSPRHILNILKPCKTTPNINHEQCSINHSHTLSQHHQATRKTTQSSYMKYRTKYGMDAIKW